MAAKCRSVALATRQVRRSVQDGGIAARLGVVSIATPPKRLYGDVGFDLRRVEDGLGAFAEVVFDEHRGWRVG